MLVPDPHSQSSFLVLQPYIQRDAAAAADVPGHCLYLLKIAVGGWFVSGFSGYYLYSNTIYLLPRIKEGVVSTLLSPKDLEAYLRFSWKGLKVLYRINLLCG